ncbi:MAG: hypothetical protein PUD92_07605, partial [Clostridiales bacterium]|nr:hypothetical protein [Clostridiales bacterium]
MKKIASLLITGAMLVSILPVMNVSAAYSGGSGTQADPYLIGSTSDWTEFRKYIDSDGDQGAGEYWKLTEDLDFTNSEGKKDWVTKIASYDTENGGTVFKGNLNGNGHVIKNYEINAEQIDNNTHMAYGLFSAIGGDAV